MSGCSQSPGPRNKESKPQKYKLHTEQGLHEQREEQKHLFLIDKPSKKQNLHTELLMLLTTSCQFCSAINILARLVMRSHLKCKSC